MEVSERAISAFKTTCLKLSFSFSYISHLNQSICKPVISKAELFQLIVHSLITEIAKRRGFGKCVRDDNILDIYLNFYYIFSKLLS